MLMQQSLDIVVLGVRYSHKINFADVVMIVSGRSLLSPEGVDLDLNNLVNTSCCLSTVPVNILFLYSSKICRSSSS